MSSIDALVRFHHVGCALGMCEASIHKLIKAGRLPAPLHTGGRNKYWQLSQLREVNPALAETVEHLLTLPRIAAV